MWNKDLLMTANVDNKEGTNLRASIEFALSSQGFFPFPRVEKLMNSQDCGVTKTPEKLARSPSEIMWKTRTSAATGSHASEGDRCEYRGNGFQQNASLLLLATPTSVRLHSDTFYASSLRFGQ
jgi:hypothetical protein